MKKNIVILETMRGRNGAFVKKGWRRFCRHANTIGAITGLAGFLLIAFSVEVAGFLLAIVSMLCLWAGDTYKTR